MSNDPLNAEVLQGIARTSFYSALSAEMSMRVFPKLCLEKPVKDETTTFTSFGSVPEPRQLSGSVASTGERQAYGLKDYKLTGTVVEWEQTLEVPRKVCESYPDEMAGKIREMAAKAIMFMDRRFVATVLPASTAGYDGVSLYNDAHPESGTNQDNNLTSAAATGTKPTAAELEADLDTELGALKGFTDDRGTPVNDGVTQFDILVPLSFEWLYRSTLEPLKGQVAALDVSGGTGRFRGMFNVHASAFVATADRHYLVARREGTAPVALLKHKDFEFKSNVGTDSDMWNFKQMGIFYSYARWEFVPWDWKTTVRQVWT